MVWLQPTEKTNARNLVVNLKEEVMVKKHGKSKLSKALLLATPLLFSPVLYAAKPIDLNQQNMSILQSLISTSHAVAANPVKIEEISRSTDFKQTLHVRFQETYAGHPVWGADGVVHIANGDNSISPLHNLVTGKGSKGSMDGVIYQDLNADLTNTPAYVFTTQQAQKALNHVIDNYQHQVGNKVKVKAKQSQLIVFIDKNNKAHWAYHTSFYVEPAKKGAMPEKPNAIIDAVTLAPYEQWNEIETVSRVSLDGGGFGGNIKMGKLEYDGLQGKLAKLRVTRDKSTCSLDNDDVTVKGFDTDEVVTFNCQATDPNHNNVYWDGELEAVNDGYSPPNDALFGGAVIKDMYEQWYGVPVLTRNGKPMKLIMVVHDDIDNAYWDGEKMTFGDGVSMFYPLTSIGVAAHEVSHGFTQQHSNLRYYGQSGGMNESFSDMAAQAGEQFAFGKTSWQIGGEIFKEKGKSLRYMDLPSKDCNGKTPGHWCSIDNAEQYRSGLDVHFSSGVYNRFFYALGTTANWDAKKAFNVLLHANANYWTSSTTFEKGACGVIKAATDLNYDVAAVKKAFDVVRIKYDRC